MLNPFHLEGSHVEERLQLFVDVTAAPWAEEHLACGLPKLQDLEQYAAAKGLQIDIKPNCALLTSMAFVSIDYFAGKAGLRSDWEKVNRFFNKKYVDIINSANYPNAYLIYLGWPQTKREQTEQTPS